MCVVTMHTQAALVPALQARLINAQQEAAQLRDTLDAAEGRNGQAQALLQELQAQAAQRDTRINDLRCACGCVWKCIKVVSKVCQKCIKVCQKCIKSVSKCVKSASLREQVGALLQEQAQSNADQQAQVHEGQARLQALVRSDSNRLVPPCCFVVPHRLLPASCLPAQVPKWGMMAYNSSNNFLSVCLFCFHKERKQYRRRVCAVPDCITPPQEDETQQLQGQLSASQAALQATQAHLQQAQHEAATRPPAVLAAVGAWVGAALDPLGDAAVAGVDDAAVHEAAVALCRAAEVAKCRALEQGDGSPAGEPAAHHYDALDGARHVAAVVLAVQQLLANRTAAEQHRGGWAGVKTMHE